MKDFREKLGLIIIVVSVVVLGVVGYIIIKKDPEQAQFVYSSLLPMVGTWVGVVLAFYFGKENYETASQGFEKIMKKLTPELLDNIPASQIMITRKTMVAKKWSTIKDKTVKEVLDFLLENEKTRLPILGDNGRVLYIVHQSLMTSAKKDAMGAVEEMDTSISMATFIQNHLGVVDKIVWVKEDTIIEDVRKTMNKNNHCKDVFVEDATGQLVGWITDTLILRYIGEKKNNL